MVGWCAKVLEQIGQLAHCVSGHGGGGEVIGYEILAGAVGRRKWQGKCAVIIIVGSGMGAYWLMISRRGGVSGCMRAYGPDGVGGTVDYEERGGGFTSGVWGCSGGWLYV